jgi:hypothetical protein
MAFGKLTGCGTSAVNIKMRTNGSHLKSVLRQNFIASKWLGCNASGLQCVRTRPHYRREGGPCGLIEDWISHNFVGSLCKFRLSAVGR